MLYLSPQEKQLQPAAEYYRLPRWKAGTKGRYKALPHLQRSAELLMYISSTLFRETGKPDVVNQSCPSPSLLSRSLCLSVCLSTRLLAKQLQHRSKVCVNFDLGSTARNSHILFPRLS